MLWHYSIISSTVFNGRWCHIRWCDRNAVDHRRYDVSIVIYLWSYQTAGPIDTTFGTHVQIHLGIDIYQTNWTSIHKGAFRGVLGGHKSKSLGRLSNDWTDWHQMWYTSADSSGNGHRLNTIRPSTLGGGGVRGSQIQKSGEDVKRLVRLASNLVHMCRFIWEWIYAKQIGLRDTRGHLGGFMGSNIQKSGEAVKRLDRLAPTLVHVCGFIWEWA